MRSTHDIEGFGVRIECPEMADDSAQFADVQAYCIEQLNAIDRDKKEPLMDALFEVAYGHIPPDHYSVKMIRDIEAGAPSHGKRVTISAQWPDATWLTKDYIPLVFADDVAEISLLEAKFGITQMQAVDDFIENSCWGEEDTPLAGGKGTPEDRLMSLRRALKAAGIP